MNTTRRDKRIHRHRRVRSVVRGTAERPRLVVFRSLQHISAQIVDDTTGKVVAAVSDTTLRDKKLQGTDRARALGRAVAEAASAKKVQAVVFDRAGYAYHGKVKALAEGAREGGLIF